MRNRRSRNLSRLAAAAVLEASFNQKEISDTLSFRNQQSSY
jgi:hypothetical protein